MANRVDGRTLGSLRMLFDVGAVGSLTDGQLLERFATRSGEGAELAFAALVERHGPMVLRTCLGILHDRHDAEDAFQATFLVLVRRAPSVRNHESIASWLHGVAKRVALRARASAARRDRHEHNAASRLADLSIKRPWDDTGAVIHEEIQRLPERFRLPIVLCDLDDLTESQAAQRLDCPVGTIRSRLARGRQRLGKQLARRGVSPASGCLAMFPLPERLPIPPHLTSRTAWAAMRLIANGGFSGAALRLAVVPFVEAECKSMVMKQYGAAILGILATATLIAGAAALARDEQEKAPPASRPSSPPQLNFEIRVWKDGRERGSPIIVNVTEAIPYQVETEDAVIRIMPRKRARTAPLDPSEEARWKMLAETRARLTRNGSLPRRDQTLPEAFDKYKERLSRKSDEGERANQTLLDNYKKAQQELLNHLREITRIQELQHPYTRLFPRMEALLQSPPPPLDRSVVARRDQLPSAWGSVAGVSPLTDEEVQLLYGAAGDWSLVAIDRGSDDALRVGQELFAYHEGKQGEYVSLGKFFLYRVDPDAAVGILLGTANAPRVARGDLVTVKEIPAAEPDSKR